MAAGTLFLLDGTALAYRSHFALARSQRLTSKSGRPTGATYGFLQTLLRLLELEKPSYLGVALDPPGPTFRHERFPDYKATRERAPEEMIAQLPAIRQILEAYRIRVLEVPGFEADDAIGTLARRAEQQGFEVRIVTRDKDFYQLVSDRVLVYDLFQTGKDPEVLGPKEVEERFGVPPEKVVEVLALMGDASDNVPGVSGVGERTAIDLVRRFGSSEEAIRRAAEIEKPKLREAIVRDAEKARLSRDLVTIRTDLLLGVEPKDLRLRPPDGGALRALFAELDFQSLLGGLATDADSDEHDWRVVADEEAFSRMLREFGEAEALVVDTETTSIDPLSAEPVGIALCAKARRAYYVPLVPECPLRGGGDEVLDRLRPLLEDERVRKCGQNAKYDALVLARRGIELRPIAFDTMVADYCLDPGGREHNLDALALRHLNYRKIPTEELIGKGKTQISMAMVPVERVGRYACEDADITMRLAEKLGGELREAGAEALFREIEMPLVPVLVRMERRGVRVDAERLRRLSKDLAERIRSLGEGVQELAGKAFNPNSNPQLGELLFEKLEVHKKYGVKRPRRTKTGYAVDADTLEAYAAEPLVAKVLEYRSLEKLRSTYLDALPGLVRSDTGRIHTSFNQTVAATGRLSSSDPNLQNIPVRTEIGREIRRAFVAGEEGWKIVSADYSQVELRLVAHFSEDRRLLEAFERDADVHRETAAAIFHGGDASAVTAEERTRAKAINFGILYGMGAPRLARETGMSVPDAQTFIRIYFETFPAVKAFLDRTLAQARSRGFVETLFGRRRFLPELHAEEDRVRAQAENVAVNTPIQGSAADAIKKAMVEVDRRLAAEGFRAAMLLQVHDELVFECPADEVRRLAARVREAMEGAARLRVRLKADVGAGDSWLDAHGGALS